MRAQIAFEYLVVFFILGLIFTFFLEFYAVYQEDFRQRRNEVLVNELGNQMQAELFAAATVHEGYRREFILPNNLEGVDYVLETHDTFAVINSQGSDYIFPIPNLEGQLKKGKNIITNKGGVLCLNPPC